MYKAPDGNKADFCLEVFNAPDGDKASFQLEGEVIEYIPPVGNKVDFHLEIFTPPAGDRASFQLQESGKNIVWANAHISLNLNLKAQALSFPIVLTPEITQVQELKTVSGTWKCPYGVVGNQILVECWGGGESGGGNKFAPPAGAGGAYARSLISVAPGKLYNFSVADRAWGGDNGKDTYWADGADVKAAGGKNGNGGSIADSVGDVIYPGGNKGSGGGGGGAGSTGPGKHGTTQAGGDATEDYGGPGGKSGSTVSGEIRGKNYGGGGGAGGYYMSGGDGAPGLIRISYTIATPVAYGSIILGAKAQAKARASKTPIEMRAHASLNLGVKAKARVKVLIEAKAHYSLAFSLRATSEIFTPLAKQPIRPSTWHPGGETRAPTIVKLSLTEPLLPEFGIGLSAKMLHGSGIKDQVFWQAGDYQLYYDVAKKCIKMQFGNVVAAIGTQLDIGNIVGVYGGIMNSNVFLQGKVAGVLTEPVQVAYGDNLLLNTANERFSEFNGENPPENLVEYYYDMAMSDKGLSLIRQGGNFCLRLHASHVGGNDPVRFLLYCQRDSGYRRYMSSLLEPGQSKYITIDINATPDNSIQSVYMGRTHYGISPGYSEVIFKDVKIETGDTATLWTPAPEDVSVVRNITIGSDENSESDYINGVVANFVLHDNVNDINPIVYLGGVT